MERWKPVVGFEGLYDVSDTGRVRSLHWSTPRLMRPSLGKDGRLYVDLRGKDGRHMRKVHHLVLEAFVSPRPPDYVCCHWDGDPLNNVLSNLRWDTRRNNEADKVRHGTDNAGERHGMSRLRIEDVRRIREAKLFGANQYDLASAYGTSQSRISLIVNNKAWRHVA